jgi:hypothetical protein
MHAATAALIVVAASAASTAFEWVIFRRETPHSASRTVLAVIFGWFLIMFTIMAFLVDPQL